MLYWIRFPLIRFLLFFITGILLSRIFDFTVIPWIWGFYILAGSYFILLFVLKKEKFIRYNILLGLTAFSVLTLSAAILSSGHNHRGDPGQLVNTDEEIKGYLARIMDIDAEDSLYTRLTVRASLAKLSQEWSAKTGQVLLIIKNDPEMPVRFLPGDRILIRGAPTPIKAPENPDQFDYRKYMFYKGTYLQHFINRDQCFLIRDGHKTNIKYLAGSLRNKCNSILSRHIPDQESRALVSALTLGARDELSDAITKDYARAGISHILAVSGLHVGIFYVILFVLFKPFNRNKTTAWIISGIIISILIVFAFVTGLTPSVMRSVILFTFIETGRRLGRKSVSFNTLAASAMFLLVINPYFIYSAGFQLSYLAVTGIIFFQPHLYRMMIFTNDIADYAWKLVTVAIAAQITTFPVTLYYFHTFPAYFMLSNIIAIPAAFLILSLGLGILSLHAIVPVAGFAGWMVSRVIHFFNLSVHSLASLPGSQVTGIRLSLPMVFILYSIVFLLMMLITEKKTRYLYGIAIFGFSLVVLTWIHFLTTLHREKIIFYSSASGPLIELVSGRNGYLITDSTLYRQPEKIRRIMENHCILDSHPCRIFEPDKPWTGISHFTGSDFGLYTWKGTSILIARDLRDLRAITYNRPVKINILVITGNAGYDISSLTGHFEPDLWIVDRSCRPAAAQNAEKILSAEGKNYIFIEKTGAYTFRLN